MYFFIATIIILYSFTCFLIIYFYPPFFILNSNIFLYIHMTKYYWE